MWFAALIGMATTFAECTLAQLYKTPNKDGGFRGGPAWYMAHGLGMRWMGIAFSFFCWSPSAWYLIPFRQMLSPWRCPAHFLLRR
ncbi:alanine:cation symporter family protein [Mangrovibacter sp. SLW1]